MAKNKILSNKKILITAGSTWVAIDQVRVITNIFGGRTGCMIAEKAKQMGSDVKLLLGPSRLSARNTPVSKIKLVNYRYFHELLSLTRREISKGHYDVIIHSAAISDYAPVKANNNKIPSGKNELIIKLKPTIKIIQQIKKWDPKIYLVQFKLEVNKTYSQLINAAYKSLLKNKSDLVVANDLKNIQTAYIIDRVKKIIKVKSRKALATTLLRIVGNNIRRGR